MRLAPLARPLALVLGAALASTLAAAIATRGAAQDPVDARAVASSVQSFYDQTKGVRARFHQTYFHKLYDRYDRSSGTVTFVKPGKMRWDYARPNGKVIAADGTLIRYYTPGEPGAAGQCIEAEMNEDQLPAAFSFLTGVGRLEDSFTFRLLDPRRQGYPEGYVLELRGRRPSPHFERILFYVLKQNDRPAGVVRRVLIVDSEGNRNRFDFSEMQWDPRVADTAFRYTPPSGVTCRRP